MDLRSRPRNARFPRSQILHLVTNRRGGEPEPPARAPQPQDDLVWDHIVLTHPELFKRSYHDLRLLLPRSELKRIEVEIGCTLVDFRL